MKTACKDQDSQKRFRLHTLPHVGLYEVKRGYVQDKAVLAKLGFSQCVEVELSLLPEWGLNTLASTNCQDLFQQGVYILAVGEVQRTNLGERL